jgi:DMSO/TMAO reductase YedYZ molybdopterin-dependent catalytic subunit
MPATTSSPKRRAFLQSALLGSGALALARSVVAADSVRLPLPGGPDERALTTAFPGKGSMVLQRTRPPLLETPFEVFDQGVFTPVDRFYVRWHWANLPDRIDPASFKLGVGGHVQRPLSLTVAELMRRFAHVELAAVNQCSGNSRGFFQPRVAGGQWGNGAMGNARWVGVRLKDVLDAAGVRAGAVQVQFEGADRPVVSSAPNLRKSLPVDHARDGEVMIAWSMNGQTLPLDNGFPMRLVVPGWYATYWTKALQSIRVLDHPDENFWMNPAYTIPDNWPQASMQPGQAGVHMVPINRMVPRSFITNLRDGAKLGAGRPELVRGIAFGGDAAVMLVELSTDGGRSWHAAALGEDHGRYSFRQWSLPVNLSAGEQRLMVRCTNRDGLQQPLQANWNPGGFMRNVVETLQVQAV